jgi:Domain of unknown function (DUF397)
MQPVFRRASFCAGGECVEVAQNNDVVILRDSTQPLGGRLHYGARDWGSFVRDVKSGKLDRLDS